MKKNTGHEQVSIQFRIEGCDGAAHPHHLGSMLDQATAPRMMIVASGSGAAKSVAELGQQRFAQGAQSRVADGFDSLQDEIPIGRLSGAQLGRALQQFVLFLFG